MDILLCMKQVPDDSVEIHLDETGNPAVSKVDPQGNAFDTYAQELAVRFTEAHEGTVTVITAGSEDDKICLKNALAVGASDACLISDGGTEGIDAAFTANLLAAGIKKIEADKEKKYDLILCGRETTDYIGSEVGELLAEALDLPFVSDVVDVEPSENGLKVKKELEADYQIVEIPIPAVLTVSKPDYEPRYPTIKSKLAARKVKIPTMEDAAAGLAEGEAAPKVIFMGYQEPPRREAGVKIQEDDPADAVAKALEQLAADKVF